MIDPIAGVVRFAAVAMQEALARRRVRLGGLAYSAQVEIHALASALERHGEDRFGLDHGAAAARAELDRALEKDHPLARIERALGLDRVERDVLRVLLAWSFDPRVAMLVGHVHDALKATRPTHGALAEILNEPLEVAAALAPSARLRSTLSVTADRFGPDALLAIDPRLVCYVLKGALSELELRSGRFALDPSCTSDPIGPISIDVLALRGPCGSGRTARAREVAQRDGTALLLLELNGVRDDVDTLITTALRDARIAGARLSISGSAADQELALLARALDVPLALRLPENALVPEVLLSRAITAVDLPVPSAKERRKLWSEVLGRSQEDEEIVRAAERYAFSPGTIRRAALQKNGCSLDDACRLQLSHGLEELRVRRKAKISWERLVLPPGAMESLHAACAQVKHRARVEDDWGFGAHHRLGQGVKMLFFGKPGTGKTLAAEIIANELDLPLYRIDLSQIVSKWIGETEKNLARLFDEAKQASAILFFDESDSLFARRTNVASSTDRYANMEVNYLLQRIEEHEGVLIMATNLKANMDHAFARRIHYAIEFPEPDASAREKIWRLSLPPNAPVSPDVPFGELARRFEIPGGAIKNVLSGAAYLAAAGDQPVGVGHIARALRREYAKMDRLYHRGELDSLLKSMS